MVYAISFKQIVFIATADSDHRAVAYTHPGNHTGGRIYLSNLFPVFNFQSDSVKAIAKEEIVNEINSATFIKKYDLKGASSINVALKSLINKEFVLKEQQGYIVYDRFLAIWLKGLV